MSIINDVKQLIARSSLFVDAEKLTEIKGNRLPKRRRMREGVKIGQGGTLDPLADGVLGENDQSAATSGARSHAHYRPFY
jgi:tRNA pseudouridine55 synthase